MRLKYLIGIVIFCFFAISFFSNTFAKINSLIVVKVGNEIITNSDLENEIKTILILSNKSISQANINQVKSVAVKNLIRNLIKKNEIKKHNMEKYNPNELEQYLLLVSNSLKIKREELKSLFEQYNLDYNSFIEKNKVELQWKTLIYSLYRNQISINTVEVENEIKNRIEKRALESEYELSEIEISSENNEIDKFLENVYKTIKTEGFQKAAKKFSISDSASRGGKIGFFPEKTLSKIYLTELKKIKSGEITKPIKNSNSLIILKIESLNLKENKNMNIEKMKEEIITKKKEEKLGLFSRSHFSNIENTTLIKFQ